MSTDAWILAMCWPDHIPEEKATSSPVPARSWFKALGTKGVVVSLVAAFHPLGQKHGSLWFVQLSRALIVGCEGWLAAVFTWQLQSQGIQLLMWSLAKCSEIKTRELPRQLHENRGRWKVSPERQILWEGKGGCELPRVAGFRKACSWTSPDKLVSPWP